MSGQLTEQQLVAALTERGHIPPGSALPPEDHSDRPWYLSMVLGVAAWLAGAFVLGFAWTLLEPLSERELFVVGAFLLAASIGLFRAGRDRTFIDQLALSTWIAGQFAIVAAVADITESWPAICASILALQIVLWFVTPSSAARLLAAFFGCCAWALFIRLSVLDESFDDRLSVDVGPSLFVWVVVWLPVAAGAWALVSTEARWMTSGWRGAIRPALTGLLLGLSVGSISADPVGTLLFGVLGTGDNHVNWLALWPLLDIGLALVTMWLAFQLRHRALIGVAIVAGLVHASRLYFLSGVSLLMKAAIIVVIGIVLLGLAAVLARQERT